MSKNKKVGQHDSFEAVEEALSKTELYIEENRKSLTIIIAVIAIVVGGYIGYKKFWLEPKEKKAETDMFVAENYFYQDSFRLALESEDYSYLGFLDIINEYGPTKTANLAHYYAGICYLRLGQFEDAIDQLESFDANDRLVSPLALCNIGDAYVEMDNYKKGVSYYEKAIALSPNSLTTPIFLKKAGLVYEELGEFKKAVEAYQSIKKDFPEADEARDIQKYITSAELKQ